MLQFYVVSFLGGSNLLGEFFAAYIGIKDQHKLIAFLIFNIRLLKHCIQKSSSVVFGSLEAFFMTEFLVTRLKGAENRDWMMSLRALRRAAITWDLPMPGLLEVVSNIVRI